MENFQVDPHSHKIIMLITLAFLTFPSKPFLRLKPVSSESSCVQVQWTFSQTVSVSLWKNLAVACTADPPRCDYTVASAKLE